MLCISHYNIQYLFSNQIKNITWTLCHFLVNKLFSYLNKKKIYFQFYFLFFIFLFPVSSSTRSSSSSRSKFRIILLYLPEPWSFSKELRLPAIRILIFSPARIRTLSNGPLIFSDSRICLGLPRRRSSQDFAKFIWSGLNHFKFTVGIWITNIQITEPFG